MMAASVFFPSPFSFVMGVLTCNRSACFSSVLVLQCSTDAGSRFQIRCCLCGHTHIHTHHIHTETER